MCDGANAMQMGGEGIAKLFAPDVLIIDTT